MNSRRINRAATKTRAFILLELLFKILVFAAVGYGIYFLAFEVDWSAGLKGFIEHVWCGRPACLYTETLQ